MRHTTTRTSTISRPQLVLRHTHTHTPTDIHTRTHTHSKTIECSPTLTHETEQLATKKHLHYRTLVDSQVLKPTLSLECSPLTNASFHGEKLLSCAPPIGPMSVQTSFEPAADTAVRSESRQTWTERKVEQQVKGLGGGGMVVVWEGSRVCRHRWRNETSKRGCGRQGSPFSNQTSHS